VRFRVSRFGARRSAKAFAAVEDDDARALERDLVELVRRFDRLDGDAVAIRSTSTEAIAVTR
jgi:hypothetical protein